MSKVSGASAALEVLRQAGLKVSTDRRQESNGAQYEMRELKISAPIATPKPSRQFADQRKAARAILHCAQILSDDVPKRPDVEIPLLFTANCGYSATLIVSDSEEPKVTLKPLNGAWAKYVIDEISEWPLDRRRQYIASIGQAFGETAAQQIRDGLKALWENRKR
jgi:hypothetical protein